MIYLIKKKIFSKYKQTNNKMIKYHKINLQL